MNARAIPTELSFGQLFLFEEMKARTSRRPEKRTRRHNETLGQPNLVRIALLGWLLGAVAAIIFQCLWG